MVPTICRREFREASRFVLAVFRVVLGYSVAVDSRHSIQHLGHHYSLVVVAEVVEDGLEEVLLNAMLSVVELAGWTCRDSTAVVVERMSAVDTTL